MALSVRKNEEEDQAPDLIRAARTTAVPFEASPTGRWVRFEGGGNAVYVVRDAWAEGCVLMTANGEDSARIRHFLRPQEAVAAAVRLIEEEYSSVLFDRDLPPAG